MSLFNSNIPHHLNGVSELPKALRKDTHGKAQTNAYPDISKGLIKRPPAELISVSGSTIGATDVTNNYAHYNGYDTISYVINEDGLERYILVLNKNWDYDGGTDTTTYYPTIYDTVNKEWVRIWADFTTSAGSVAQWLSYFKTTKSSDFSFATIGDTTFISNSNITVAEDTTETSTPLSQAGLISVQQSLANVDYYVEINGIRLESEGGAKSGALSSVIAGDIVKQINNNTAMTFESINITGTNLRAANTAGSNLILSVTGKNTADTPQNTAWTRVGDIVEITAVAGDIYTSFMTALTKKHPLKTGDRFKIRTTTCTTGAATGAVTLSHITSGKPVEFWGMRTSDATANFSFKCQTKTVLDSSGDPFLEDFTATQKEHQVVIVNNKGEDFSLSAGIQENDGTDTPEKAFLSVKGEVQDISDLPLTAPNGFKVKVFGKIGTGQDDYYLEFKTADNSTWGRGAWFESNSGDDIFKIDSSTMPHVLIKQTDGSFLLKRADGTITGRRTPDSDDLAFTPVTNHYARITKETVSGTIHDPESHLLAAASSDAAINNAHAAVEIISVAGFKPNQTIPMWSTLTLTEVDGSTNSFDVYEDSEADEHGIAALRLGKDNTAADVGADLPLSSLGANYYAHGGTATVVIKYNYEDLKWGHRFAGNPINNPMPQFVGKSITDVFVHEGRLALCSPDGVNFSESGNFFNFFRVSLTELLDTAPIELEIAGENNVYIKKGVPIKESVILFSNNDQFIVTAGTNAFTGKTVSVSHSSSYSIDTTCEPVKHKDSVFAVSSSPSTSGLLEFLASDKLARSYIGYDIATTAPNYLPKEIKQIAVLPQEGLVAILPKVPDVTDAETEMYAEQKDIYFYKYTDVGNERQQSALFKFTLSLPDFVTDNNLEKDGGGADIVPIPQIRSIQAVGNKLFIYAQMLHYVSGDMGYNRSTTNYITTYITSIYEMDFSKTADNDYNDTLTYLDNKCYYDGDNPKNSAGSDYSEIQALSKGFAYQSDYSSNTTFKVPFRWDSTTTTPVVVTKAKSGDAGGTVITPDSMDGTTGTIILTGDQRATHLYFGVPYTMSYEYFSPVIRSQSAEGNRSFIHGGRYQVNKAEVAYEDTSDFTVTVTPKGRNTYTYSYTADSTDVESTTSGGLTTSTGVYTIPVRSKVDTYSMTLSSSSHKPVNILSTEYEGKYTSRSKSR
ncbi:hypothetical protein [Acinetobacter sp.]|uniref:phage nozzle protein n=1 Tax=Acinetobacter sp. TaxID=472 RepID=UPI000C0B24DE|nr:hypothetical protein [Acinetobacter sp.]MAK29814.1 hypothetical protein [Acinetobacter sp.]|tara:strand:- start:4750 stop:8310 length:3561 start_codon:yes stop_codon:yes gene_type:complete